MAAQTAIVVFGEVLYDCFPKGEEVLGGAPFNVAWHLQAFGDDPFFISRIGNDPRGQHIVSEMRQWGMDLSQLQVDSFHPTGEVKVILKDGEPHYEITENCAYDFIKKDEVQPLPEKRILYHGTLGVRSHSSSNALSLLKEGEATSVFLDVNLREPWWKEEDVAYLLEAACWVKLNQDELKQLGYEETDVKQAMKRFLDAFHLKQLILTCGSEGAKVLDNQGGFYEVVPEFVTNVVDTVGAGDAFTSVYLHGLLHDWPVDKTLQLAQTFASRIIGLRGATTNDMSFYENILTNMEA